MHRQSGGPAGGSRDAGTQSLCFLNLDMMGFSFINDFPLRYLLKQFYYFSVRSDQIHSYINQIKSLYVKVFFGERDHPLENSKLPICGIECTHHLEDRVCKESKWLCTWDLPSNDASFRLDPSTISP